MRRSTGPPTARQFEILRLVAVGESNPGIAVALGISPGTVRWAFEGICRQLDVQSRSHAIAVMDDRYPGWRQKSPPTRQTLLATIRHALDELEALGNE